MKAVVLIENTAPQDSGLAAEHGLSIYIEHRGRKLLLDSGSSGDFADNAEKLGVDLTQVELGVLSHAHYDHADGLRRFFRINIKAQVHLRRGGEAPLYAADPDKVRFIGIHPDLWTYHRDRFTEVEGCFPLMEGSWLTPGTVRDPAFMGRADNLLYKRGENDFIPDDFRHEQSLVLETEKGLIVFNSCSHTGIVNIVRGVQQQFPERRIYAVVGGLHMFGKDFTGMNCTPEYVFSVADALKDMGVEQIYTGHCTGEAALALMQEHFGPGCHALTAGLRFSF